MHCWSDRDYLIVPLLFYGTIPPDRGSSHLTSGALPSSSVAPALLLVCSANMMELYPFPLFSRRRALVNRAVNSVIKVLRKVVSLVVQKEVSPLFLGAQGQACWGQV